MRTTRVHISENGQHVTMNSEGFIGSGCATAVQPYLDKLGIGPGDVAETRKPEYDAVEDQEFQA